MLESKAYIGEKSMSVEYAEFSPLHIDIARFATDDFNLFHDAKKWRRLPANPFGGPIVLGFQTETWLAEAVARYRFKHDDPGLLKALRFSTYQIRFAAALKPNQRFSLTIKPSHWDPDQAVLSNRLILRSESKIVLIGYHKLSQRPLVLPDFKLPELFGLASVADRSEVGGFFLKRKFMMTANAKNFLLGCSVDPSCYFDELEGRVEFPELFPVSYISCALLERARHYGHDFERAPMVYTWHEFSIDRQRVARIASNDRLHVLVAPAEEDKGGFWFYCLGLIEDDLLFRARIELVPLQDIVKAITS
jgi:hypothetical protein